MSLSAEYKQDREGRNPAIEALRFLSIFQICLWHMSYPFTAAGFLGVEFFFVLAGFFMYRTAVRPDGPGILAYTFRKLRKFWFKIIFALILTYAIFYQGIILEIQENWLIPVLRFISEALLLQSIGSFVHGLNNPIWFFSALIYGGALVYGMSKYYTKISIRLVFPIITVLYFAYTFKNGTQETLENWDVVGCIPLALVRGICEISFGVLIGYIYFNYGERLKYHINVLNLVAVVALVLYLAIITDNRRFSQYALVFIPVLICAATTPNTIFDKLLCGKVWIFLGRISFDIFIIHYPLIALFRHFLLVEAALPLWLVAMLYYLALIPSAYIFDRVAAKIKSLLFCSRMRPNTL